jgi:hypothetical protein
MRKTMETQRDETLSKHPSNTIQMQTKCKPAKNNCKQLHTN